MLPRLPDTSILTHPPDGEDIALLADGYSIKSVPRGMGVYCFYDPSSAEIVYVGSGCGFDASGRKNCGLYLRMQLYRFPRTTHDRKIAGAIKQRGLLLRVWLTETEGDARKYEADAIALLQPCLNVAGVRKTPYKDIQLKRSIYGKELRQRRIEKGYDPNLKRKCTRCTAEKKCSDFRRSQGRPLGTHSVCRMCEADVRQQQSTLRRQHTGKQRHHLTVGQKIELLNKPDLSLAELARQYNVDESTVFNLRKRFKKTGSYPTR